MNEYIHIGKLVASFGVKGEVIIEHSLGKKSNFANCTVLFIEERKGSYMPYFIESAKAKTVTESIVKIEGINTPESAKKILHKPVWLNEADFRKMAAKAAPIALIGFTVIENNKVLGIVEEVIEQPHQILLCIQYNNKEAYIPLHEESLQKINHPKKEIIVSLPEGLLDIYA